MDRIRIIDYKIDIKGKRDKGKRDKDKRDKDKRDKG